MNESSMASTQRKKEKNVADLCLFQQISATYIFHTRFDWRTRSTERENNSCLCSIRRPHNDAPAMIVKMGGNEDQIQ